MPPAARITDNHLCPMTGPAGPHTGGPVLSGEPTVLIANQPAARTGDKLDCKGPVDDAIAQGEPTVLINNKPAARLGDATDHGGAIVVGCPTVLIGSSAQADTLKTDRPLCEECTQTWKRGHTRRKRGKG